MDSFDHVYLSRPVKMVLFSIPTHAFEPRNFELLLQFVNFLANSRLGGKP
jgi:hypothetical protein